MLAGNQDDPASSLAKLETQQSVAASVMALDGPYRQTLILRYVEDLSSAEIARELGVPGATIRSRLKRGLELLRVDFSKQHDDTSWRLALAPFVAPAKAAPSATSAVPIGGKAGIGVLAIATVAALVAVAANSKSSPSLASPTTQEAAIEAKAVPSVQSLETPIISAHQTRSINPYQPVTSNALHSGRSSDARKVLCQRWACSNSKQAAQQEEMHKETRSWILVYVRRT